jgi:hypothetical protein
VQTTAAEVRRWSLHAVLVTSAKVHIDLGPRVTRTTIHLITSACHSRVFRPFPSFAIVLVIVVPVPLPSDDSSPSSRHRPRQSRGWEEAAAAKQESKASARASSSCRSPGVCGQKIDGDGVWTRQPAASKASRPFRDGHVVGCRRRRQSTCGQLHTHSSLLSDPKGFL